MSRLGRGALMGEGDPSPIAVDGRTPAVLALHGFGGTPLEVELAVDVARELGLRAHAPLLPGHGTHAQDLARTRFSDWADAAARSLDALATPEEPAIVTGLSLGGVLGLHLAATRSDRVRALLVLGNAMWLSRSSDLALRLLDRLDVRNLAVPKAAPDIADPASRRTHLTYSSQPVGAAIEVLRAGERVLKALDRVTCPVLIAHGRRDRVCPVRNAERVARHIASFDKRVVVFPRSRHILTRDLERAEVRREMLQFMARFA